MDDHEIDDDSSIDFDSVNSNNNVGLSLSPKSSSSIATEEEEVEETEDNLIRHNRTIYQQQRHQKLSFLDKFILLFKMLWFLLGALMFSFIIMDSLITTLSRNEKHDKSKHRTSRNHITRHTSTSSSTKTQKQKMQSTSPSNNIQSTNYIPHTRSKPSQTQQHRPPSPYTTVSGPKPQHMYELQKQQQQSQFDEIHKKLEKLNGQCFDTFYQPEWWSYIWCYKKSVQQIHVNFETKQLESQPDLTMDQYLLSAESSPLKHVYESRDATCNYAAVHDTETIFLKPRKATVFLKCCDETTINNYKTVLGQNHQMQFSSKYYDMKFQTFIESVHEPAVCEYVLHICTESLCENLIPSATGTAENDSDTIDENSVTSTTPAESTQTQTQSTNNEKQAASTTNTDDYYNSDELQDKLYSVTPSEQILLREKVRKMFLHGYYGYMNHAFPEGELKPISCEGGPFEPIKLPIVTLIDSLDTLAIMGEYNEFREAVSNISNYMDSFDYDVNVSVFETTIRILGGLLSAHLLAVDPTLKIYDMVNQTYTRLAPYTRTNLQFRQTPNSPSPFPAPTKPTLQPQYMSKFSNTNNNNNHDHATNNRHRSGQTRGKDVFDASTQHKPYATRRKLVLSKYHSTADGSWPWSLPSKINNSHIPVSDSKSTSSRNGSDSSSMKNEYTYYDNWLLTLAIDLGERLLPAFKTDTGIPYGTVNLRTGVPPSETEISSTAGAGSLSIEFEVLSRLTGDKKFGAAAYNAMKELYSRRSALGLLGKHISTKSGLWVETASGIGSNADSFYEYLLKNYLLFDHNEDDENFENDNSNEYNNGTGSNGSINSVNAYESYLMFIDTYTSIKKYVQYNDWFTELDMYNKLNKRNRVESLHGFWPGMETSLGLTVSSSNILNALYGAWMEIGFLPEELDQNEWLYGKGTIANPYYPLRPELIESTYHHYVTTKDRSWLQAGVQILEAIETHTATECGFASIKDVTTKEVLNEMPSFYLSETLKYLYLLFDETNFIHDSDHAYIFSTEAHPFDKLQLPELPHNISPSSMLSKYKQQQSNHNMHSPVSSPISNTKHSFSSQQETSPHIDTEIATAAVNEALELDHLSLDTVTPSSSYKDLLQTLNIHESYMNHLNNVAKYTIAGFGHYILTNAYVIPSSSLLTSEKLPLPPSVRITSSAGKKSIKSSATKSSKASNILKRKTITYKKKSKNNKVPTSTDIIHYDTVQKMQTGSYYLPFSSTSATYLSLQPVSFTCRKTLYWDEQLPATAFDPFYIDKYYKLATRFKTKFEQDIYQTHVINQLINMNEIMTLATDTDALSTNSTHVNNKLKVKAHSHQSNYAILNNQKQSSDNNINNKQYKQQYNNHTFLSFSSPSTPSTANTEYHRYPDKCYHADLYTAAISRGHAETAQSSAGSTKPVQKVELNMGAMGVFRVEAHTDGFHIESDFFGDTMSIFNIGNPVVFIENYMTKEVDNPDEKQIYISDRATSITYTCSIDIVQKNKYFGQINISDNNIEEEYVPVDLSDYNIYAASEEDTLSDIISNRKENFQYMGSYHARPNTGVTPLTADPQSTRHTESSVDTSEHQSDWSQGGYSIYRNEVLSKQKRRSQPTSNNKRQSSDNSISNDPNPKNIQKIKLTGAWKRSCALAGFGTLAPFLVVAPISIPPADQTELCSPLISTSNNPTTETLSNADSSSSTCHHFQPSQSSQQTATVTSASDNNTISSDTDKSNSQHSTDNNNIAVTPVISNYSIAQKLMKWIGIQPTTSANAASEDSENHSVSGSSNSPTGNSKSNSDSCTNNEKWENSDYKNTIVIGKRGVCMFEDKSIFAQQVGSLATIITNIEDNIFIMAGKKVQQTAPTDDATAETTSTSTADNSNNSNGNNNENAKSTVEQITAKVTDLVNDVLKGMKSNDRENTAETSSTGTIKEETVNIPSVMLSKSDSEELQYIFQSIKENYSDTTSKQKIEKTSQQTMASHSKASPLLRIRSTAVPMTIDSLGMGYQDFPKIRLHDTVITVSGRKQWGAILTSDGKVWQLYIVSKQDLENPHIANWYAYSGNKQPVNVLMGYTSNPVELYYNFIQNKCPLYVTKDISSPFIIVENSI